MRLMDPTQIIAFEVMAEALKTLVRRDVVLPMRQVRTTSSALDRSGSRCVWQAHRGGDDRSGSLHVATCGAGSDQPHILAGGGSTWNEDDDLAGYHLARIEPRRVSRRPV